MLSDDPRLSHLRLISVDETQILIDVRYSIERLAEIATTLEEMEKNERTDSSAFREGVRSMEFGDRHVSMMVELIYLRKMLALRDDASRGTFTVWGTNEDGRYLLEVCAIKPEGDDLKARHSKWPRLELRGPIDGLMFTDPVHVDDVIEGAIALQMDIGGQHEDQATSGQPGPGSADQ